MSKNPKRGNSSAEDSLYAGELENILQNSKTVSVWRVGAFSLLGRAKEASREAEKLAKAWPGGLQSKNREALLALFFLGLATIRNSDYKMGKYYISCLNSKSKNVFEVYLHYQLNAFFQFFICHYLAAEKSIQKAELWLEKTELPAFWHLLTSDLSAHISFRRGRIQNGFKNLKTAGAFAQSLKNSFSEEAILVAEAIYRSTYDLDQEESLREIEKLLTLYRESENFFYFNIALEYVRRLNLMGELKKSEQQLEKIKKLLFTTSLNRQKTLWCFRFAHLLYLQGSSEQALFQLNAAEDFINPEQDRVLKTQILGLQHKILRQLQTDAEQLKVLEKEILSISNETQDIQSLSHCYRMGWLSKPITEDPHSQFFHLWQGQKEKKGDRNFRLVQKMIASGWISLLTDLIPSPRTQYILLDILPKKGVLFSRNQIVILKDLSPLVRKVLLLLAKSRLTKKEFVELIWGYQYDSLSHDNLIYTAISRTRDFLGAHKDILVIKEKELQLVDCQVEAADILPKKEIRIQNSETSERPGNIQVLSLRQMDILEFLSHHRSITIKEMVEIFKVKRLTAFRDLNQLLQNGYIQRWGRGRNTCYSLPRQK